VASVHEYKRFENNLVERVKNGALVAARGVGSFFRALGRMVTRRYTVVFVPHSEKKVYNLHITVLSVLCFFLVLAGVLGVFFWYGLSYGNVRGTLTDKDSRLKDAYANLDQLRGEIALLLGSARNFEPALAETISTLGPDAKGSAVAPSGDFSTFFAVNETPEGVLPEVEGVKRLTKLLSEAVDPLLGLGTLLDSQNALLTEIPSIWPIKGGIGHVSMYFGQNENPFTGQTYIHKGIDLSTYRQGDPIVATADGQVVSVEFDQGGFGNNVIIRHKHGFYTRYGHMLSFRVHAGQQVQQGEVLGYIGNTGLSTGPHVHYEVHIGSDVVDPYKYLNIRSNIAKSGR
jgi:murein DD-endopeptidase MepM/ murein hydrolase activator NlpD